MPGSGKIDKGDKWHIEIEWKGPVSKDRSDKFTDELNKLLKKYKAEQTKGETVPDDEDC
mgnify:CR=1 FL=1|jgi:hypothetical protein